MAVALRQTLGENLVQLAVHRNVLAAVVRHRLREGLPVTAGVTLGETEAATPGGQGVLPDEPAVNAVLLLQAEVPLPAVGVDQSAPHRRVVQIRRSPPHAVQLFKRRSVVSDNVVSGELPAFLDVGDEVIDTLLDRARARRDLRVVVVEEDLFARIRRRRSHCDTMYGV